MNAVILGHGATAAHRTLNPWIQVRILVPRLSKKKLKTEMHSILDLSDGYDSDVFDCHARSFVKE